MPGEIPTGVEPLQSCESRQPAVFRQEYPIRAASTLRPLEPFYDDYAVDGRWEVSRHGCRLVGRTEWGGLADEPECQRSTDDGRRPRGILCLRTKGCFARRHLGCRVRVRVADGGRPLAPTMHPGNRLEGEAAGTIPRCLARYGIPLLADALVRLSFQYCPLVPMRALSFPCFAWERSSPDYSSDS